MSPWLAGVVGAIVGALLKALGDYWLQASRIKADKEARKQVFDRQDARVQQQELAKTNARAAIMKLLTEAEPKRSFETIQKRIGGFQGDELRMLILETGGVRFESPGGKEWWGLQHRN